MNTCRVLSKNYIQTAILYPAKTFNHHGKQMKDTFRQCLKKLTSQVPYQRKYWKLYSSKMKDKNRKNKEEVWKQKTWTCWEICKRNTIKPNEKEFHTSEPWWRVPKKTGDRQLVIWYVCAENCIERLLECMGKLSHKDLENKANGNTRQLLIPGKTKLYKEGNVIIVYNIGPRWTYIIIIKHWICLRKIF